MNLYRVVRTDPLRKPAQDVRFGSIHMVKGIVRDTESLNRSRRRTTASFPEPRSPIQLTIELVTIQSLTDVTAEFLEGS